MFSPKFEVFIEMRETFTNHNEASFYSGPNSISCVCTEESLVWTNIKPTFIAPVQRLQHWTIVTQYAIQFKLSRVRTSYD